MHATQAIVAGRMDFGDWKGHQGGDGGREPWFSKS
jgi:hypothetical protein